MKVFSALAGLAGVVGSITPLLIWGPDEDLLWFVPGGLAGAMLFYQSLFDGHAENVISLFLQRKALEEKQKIKKLSGD